MLTRLFRSSLLSFSPTVIKVNTVKALSNGTALGIRGSRFVNRTVAALPSGGCTANELKEKPFIKQLRTTDTVKITCTLMETCLCV